MREVFRSLPLDRSAARDALFAAGVATWVPPDCADGADDYGELLGRVLAVAPRPLDVTGAFEDGDPRSASLRLGGKTVYAALHDWKYVDPKLFALVNAALEVAGRDERVVELADDLADPYVVLVVDPDEKSALDRVGALARSVYVAEIEPSIFREQPCRRPAPRDALVRCVARRLGTDDLAVAEAALDAWVARTRAAVRAGERVKISRFGNFVVRDGRRGRRVEFKPSALWKDALAGVETSRFEDEPVRPEHAPPLAIRDVMSGEHDGVVVPTLGTFAYERFEAYSGRNPRTGERIHVPAKTLPTFLPDAALTRHE